MPRDDLEIHPFDPARATDADWQEIYDLTTARLTVDWPETPLPSYESVVHRIRTGAVGPNSETMWVARQNGALVGSGYYEIYLGRNPDVALITVHVHPGRRRQGIGTAVFRELLARARRDGRTHVVGTGVRAGHAAAEWAAKVGFGEPALRLVMQQLDIADVDPAVWEVSGPEGYRLVAWIGPAPEEILASYARARHAIEDSVVGDLTWDEPDWSPEKVRQEEADFAAQHEEMRVVVAIHEASGEVAGITQVTVPPVQPVKAFQRDTAVLREHRGHGLGRAMKAAMMRRLIAERPDTVSVVTQTGDVENMARINTELGYRTLAEYSIVEAEIAELEKHMGPL